MDYKIMHILKASLCWKYLTLSTLGLCYGLFNPLLQTVMSVKNQNGLANSVDNESSYQDLHCLHNYLVWSIELKEILVK